MNVRYETDPEDFCQFERKEEQKVYVPRPVRPIYSSSSSSSDQSSEKSDRSSENSDRSQLDVSLKDPSRGKSFKLDEAEYKIIDKVCK